MLFCALVVEVSLCDAVEEREVGSRIFFRGGFSTFVQRRQAGRGAQGLTAARRDRELG